MSVWKRMVLVSGTSYRIVKRNVLSRGIVDVFQTAIVRCLGSGL